jgi:C-terminal processing protease CtpA/Prc
LGLGSILEDGEWIGMKVTELIARSPAAEVGVIKVADELLAVDGESYTRVLPLSSCKILRPSSRTQW